jgi:hypothetical protein
VKLSGTQLRVRRSSTAHPTPKTDPAISVSRTPVVIPMAFGVTAECGLTAYPIEEILCTARANSFSFSEFGAQLGYHRTKGHS